MEISIKAAKILIAVLLVFGVGNLILPWTADDDIIGTWAATSGLISVIIGIILLVKF